MSGADVTVVSVASATLSAVRHAQRASTALDALHDLLEANSSAVSPEVAQASATLAAANAQAAAAWAAIADQLRPHRKDPTP